MTESDGSLFPSQRTERVLSLPTLCRYVLGAAACFLFIGFVRQEAPWMMSKVLVLVGFGFATSYVIGEFFLDAIRNPEAGWASRILRAAVFGTLICLPAAVLAYATIDQIGHIPLIAELVFVVSLLIISQLPLAKALLWVATLVAFGASLAPSFSSEARSVVTQKLSGQPKPTTVSSDQFSVAFSALYDLKLTAVELFVPRKFMPGGALSVLDSQHTLLVSSDGELRLLTFPEATVRMSDAQANTPFERTTFDRDVANANRYFRVTGMLTEHVEDTRYRVWLSYHHWHVEQQCVTLRIAESTLDLDGFGEHSLNWDTVFESTPCLPAASMHNTTGGKLTHYEENKLLLTVGETSMDHSHLAQDESASYGKILILDRADWSVSLLSKGHRNPQGLLVDAEGIWSTEHGPQGGDEFNKIVPGENYGWPQTTYGTEYGLKTWPGSTTPGVHSVGTPPLYAWIPSIGVSNLIRVEGTLFDAWRNDFLVASLDGGGNGLALFRVKVLDHKVRIVERIDVKTRVRDLVELPDGRLLLWDGVRSLHLVESASHVFASCYGCHALRDDTHGIGPDLWSVVGREVGYHEDYTYSEAMRAYGGTWTVERLDAFLADPQGEVPGTSMNMPGISDPQLRRDIIQYIDKLSQ
ncbi:MAG: PQQ-dependent sugar dehydrogenase [Pseudomonadota bacterium]